MLFVRRGLKNATNVPGAISAFATQQFLKFLKANIAPKSHLFSSSLSYSLVRKALLLKRFV